MWKFLGAIPAVVGILALSWGSDIAPTCSAAEYRQFDFFAGDWDTYDVADPSKLVARNHVTRWWEAAPFGRFTSRAMGW